MYAIPTDHGQFIYIIDYEYSIDTRKLTPKEEVETKKVYEKLKELSKNIKINYICGE